VAISVNEITALWSLEGSLPLAAASRRTICWLNFFCGALFVSVVLHFCRFTASIYWLKVNWYLWPWHWGDKLCFLATTPTNPSDSPLIWKKKKIRSSKTWTYDTYSSNPVPVLGLIWRGAFDSSKNHKRQRRKRLSVSAKREKSQMPKVLTAILTPLNLT